MQFVGRTACALIAMCLAVPAAATEAPVPAPGIGEDDPSKFFWFHKPDISVETARIDIRYCGAQAGSIKALHNPAASGGGLLGALVVGMLKGATEASQSRRMVDAGMRKCLGLYGYQRYHVPEPQWNAMMRAPDATERLAAFAAGPVPATRRLDP